MPLLDPTIDLVFKLLLTREKALLIDMLEGVLQRPIRELTLLDADIPGELASDKTIILDVRAMLDDGTHVDVEMQIRAGPALRPRIVYYSTRGHSDQLNRGDGYHLLQPTVVIVWAIEPLFPDLDRLHSIFELRERHTHWLFSDQLAIHVLQLSCLSSSKATGYDAKVERWARFFTGDEAELERLAAEDPTMALALQTLESLSQDPATHRRARERADALKLYEMDLAVSKAEGEAKGRAEGEAKGRAALLLTLLGARFGPPSAAARARVEAATIEQLDAWAERAFTATTLDELLAA